MFRTLPMTAWDRSWESTGRGRVFISLDGSTDKADILKRIGNVLKGSEKGPGFVKTCGDQNSAQNSTGAPPKNG